MAWSICRFTPLPITALLHTLSHGPGEEERRHNDGEDKRRMWYSRAQCTEDAQPDDGMARAHAGRPRSGGGGGGGSGGNGVGCCDGRLGDLIWGVINCLIIVEEVPVLVTVRLNIIQLPPPLLTHTALGTHEKEHIAAYGRRVKLLRRELDFDGCLCACVVESTLALQDELLRFPAGPPLLHHFGGETALPLLGPTGVVPIVELHSLLVALLNLATDADLYHESERARVSR